MKQSVRECGLHIRHRNHNQTIHIHEFSGMDDILIKADNSKRNPMKQEKGKIGAEQDE